MNRRLKQAGGMRPALALAVALGLLAFASSAFAYLDPSTGSMVVSAIVGIFASIALAVKTYWYRLKNLFKARSRDADRDAADPSQDNSRDG